MTNHKLRNRVLASRERMWSWQRPASGLTLIEVVASLLLCGMLFSFVISGFNQQRRQFRHAALVQRAFQNIAWRFSPQVSCW